MRRKETRLFHLFFVFLLLFMWTGITVAEAGSCIAIKRAWEKKKTSLEAQIAKARAQKTAVRQKVKAAKAESNGIETRKVKKLYKKMDKHHATWMTLQGKLNYENDQFDRKFTDCIDTKMQAQSYKRGWTNIRFGQAYVSLLQAEDRLQQRLRKCIKDAVAEELDMEVKCADIHVLWTEAENAKWELIDRALK